MSAVGSRLPSFPAARGIAGPSTGVPEGPGQPPRLPQHPLLRPLCVASAQPEPSRLSAPDIRARDTRFPAQLPAGGDAALLPGTVPGEPTAPARCGEKFHSAPWVRI